MLRGSVPHLKWCILCWFSCHCGLAAADIEMMIITNRLTHDESKFSRVLKHPHFTNKCSREVWNSLACWQQTVVTNPVCWRSQNVLRTYVQHRSEFGAEANRVWLGARLCAQFHQILIQVWGPKSKFFSLKLIAHTLTLFESNQVNAYITLISIQDWARRFAISGNSSGKLNRINRHLRESAVYFQEKL